MEELFHKAKKVIDCLESHGYEAYFVGGSVRDLTMGREIGDVDIATSAEPSDIQSIFQKTVDVGAEHGTIIVLDFEIPFEVTTFRQEGEYEDFRRPSSVKFIKSLKEDLKRRDFTMNAMAMTKDGDLIDYFGGKEAIWQKSIQTVGNPFDRFHEDALRMLRAIRFMSQLSFTLHPETKEAICKNYHLLEKVSVERKTVEFEKLMKGPNVSRSLEELLNTMLYKHLPKWEHYKDRILELSQFPIRVHTSNEVWLLVTYVFAVEDVEDFLRAWKLPGKVIRFVLQSYSILTEVLNSNWSPFLLYQTGLENAIQIERVRQVLTKHHDEGKLEELKESYESLPIKNRKELVMNGQDVMKLLNLKPGPKVKEIIEYMERAVINGIVQNVEDELKGWLITCNQRLEENC